MSIYKYKKQIDSIDSEKTGLEYPFHAGKWNLKGRIHAPVLDVPFPYKVRVTNKILKNIGILKSFIIDSLFIVSNPFALLALGVSFLSSKRVSIAISRFVRVSFKVIGDDILKPKHLTLFSNELVVMLYLFFSKIHNNDTEAIKIAEVFTHIIEHDDSYRLRVQDLFSATSQTRLSKRPIRELIKLAQISKARDMAGVSQKFNLVIFALCIILLIPRYRKALKYGVENVEYDNLRLQEDDLYWTFTKSNYDFMGVPHKDRLKWIKRKGWKLPKKLKVHRQKTKKVIV
jgi:hypothetical protein